MGCSYCFSFLSLYQTFPIVWPWTSANAFESTYTRQKTNELWLGMYWGWGEVLIPSRAWSRRIDPVRIVFRWCLGCLDRGEGASICDLTILRFWCHATARWQKSFKRWIEAMSTREKEAQSNRQDLKTWKYDFCCFSKFPEISYSARSQPR